MNGAKSDAYPKEHSESIPFNKVPDNVKSKRRILIVDDNRIVLKVTATKLEAYGYEVHTAEDGGSAISKLREVQPELLLLDLSFPPDIAHGGGVPWDGLLLLSWLRRMTEAEHLQVIAITGGELSQYKERCLEAGVLDIFLKPLDIEALVTAIRRALRQAPRVQQPAPTPGRRDDREENKLRRLPNNSVSRSEPVVSTDSDTRKRILFVDDESDWRYMGELYLKECGYDVTTTGDAVSALAQANTVQPHLIVLDLNLPDQGGETLMKLLVEAHPEIPILIYTGRELDQAQVSKLREEGAFDCLRKGTMEELLSVIGRAIGGGPGGTTMITKGAGDVTRGELQAAKIAQETCTSTEPLEAESPEKAKPASEAQAHPETAVTETETESVLVIAREGEVRNSLCSFLKPPSFILNCVPDGENALKEIVKAKVDLIFFDMAVAGTPLDKFYHALESAKPELCRQIIFITNDDVHPALDGFVRRVRGVTIWQPFTLEELLEAAQTLRKRTKPASDKIAGGMVRAMPG